MTIVGGFGNGNEENCQKKNENDLLKEISEHIFNPDVLGAETIKHSGGFRAGSSISIYSLPNLGWSSSISMFQYLDAYSVAYPDKIKKEKLNQIYQRLF